MPLDNLKSAICSLVLIVVSQNIFTQNNAGFLVSNEEILKKEYSSKERSFTGIPSIAATPDGKLWVTWYAGISPGEDKNNYVVLANSSDNGSTWKEILIADPDGSGEIRAFDPQIWCAPDKTLWLFWAQTVGHNGIISELWATKTKLTDKDSLSWETPKMLCKGIMMEKPTVLSDGTWMLPVSTWRNTDYSAKVVVSNDKGDTWNTLGACHVPEEVREFDEHIVIEKKNNSLWMLVRTNYGIGESYSTDKGKTWSELKASSIKHTSSRFFVGRLKSGNLLLVKHGPISKATGRSHLMAFISKNDGRTWSKGLLIDERSGVSYPDVQKYGDVIYLTYDYNRTSDQQILMNTFKEEDILSKKYDEKIYEMFSRRNVVSKGGK